MPATARRQTEPELELARRATPALLGQYLEPRYFKRPPHVDLMARQVVKAVTGQSRRQIWSMPPRHSKTETGPRWGSLWALEWFPEIHIMYGTYGQPLASNVGRFIRNKVVMHRDRLNLRLSEDSKAADQWNTPQGGGFLGTSVGGKSAGFGGDLIWIDDPYKDWKEAHSPTVRENVWEWYGGSMRPRLEPGGSIIVIHTRWHEDDLAGKLEQQDLDGEGEGWEIIRFPAIAEAGDILGRRPGEPLWPERYDLEDLDALRRSSGPYLFAALYQQRPAPPEGHIFKRTWWQHWLWLPNDLTGWCTSWDMTFKGNDTSDYVVGQLWARRGDADRYLVDQVRGQWDLPETIKQVQAFHDRCVAAGRRPQRHFVEYAANGPDVIKALRRKIPGLIPVEAKGTKVARAHAVTGQIESGNVFIPNPHSAPWVPDYIEELSAFDKAAHDDQVDATTQALSMMQGVAATASRPRRRLPGQAGT